MSDLDDYDDDSRDTNWRQPEEGESTDNNDNELEKEKDSVKGDTSVDLSKDLFDDSEKEEQSGEKQI